MVLPTCNYIAFDNKKAICVTLKSSNDDIYVTPLTATLMNFVASQKTQNNENFIFKLYFFNYLVCWSFT